MSYLQCTNNTCAGIREALHAAHARINALQIQMQKVQRDAEQLNRLFKTQGGGYHIECEQFERWMHQPDDPTGPGLFRPAGLAPVEPMWQAPQEHLDFLGRESVQNKLYVPKLDDYRGVAPS